MILYVFLSLYLTCDFNENRSALCQIAFTFDCRYEVVYLFLSLLSLKGLEDHLGDMDFKIAGTRSGVTAIQLDIKPAGIPLDIICESLEPARKGRIQILDHMEQEINVPRTQDGRNSPRICKYN